MKRYHRIYCFLTVLSGLMFCISSSHGQDNDDDPFAPQKPGKEDAAWGNEKGWTGSAVALNARDTITSGGIGCPIIVAGNQAFDCKTLSLVSKFDIKYSGNTLTALSSDGTYFAVAGKSTNQKDTPVFVFEVATGKKVCEIPGEEEQFLDILQITRDKYIATSGRSIPTVKVWNAENGKLMKEFKLEENSRINQGKLAFTSNGKYLAVVQQKELNVFQVSRSKIVATMQPPTKEPIIPASKNKTTGKKKLSRIPKRNTRKINFSSNDHVFMYAWIQDMAFSPDGKELAAVTTHPDNRLLCWNQKSKLEANVPYKLIGRKAFAKHNIQWFPDAKHWMVAGHIIERSTGNVLLAFDLPFATEAEMYVIDQDTLIGRLPRKRNELSRVTIPWTKIAASQAAIAKKTPAYVAPYQPVDIHVELGDLHGDAKATEESITKALTERLHRNGIIFKPGAETYFKLRFSESKGDALPIYERQSPFDRQGRDTGRTATEAKGNLIVELYVEDKEQPIWRDNIKAKSGTSYREEINDLTLRKSMLSQLSHSLGKIQFPYFMPKDDKLIALPVILE